MKKQTDPLSIIVVGASGDLARKKIFPALFSLHSQGFLPETFNIFGFARSEFSHEAFRSKIAEHLTCRYTPGEQECADLMAEFLDRCYYVQGQYDSADSFLDLYQAMKEVEHGSGTNRMFYLAIPPTIFMDVARAIGDAGLVSCTENKPWSRAVIEKPFGRDRASSDRLTNELAQVFTEEQTFRIDHYLGKEVIQNLMVLRFANLVFEPVWNGTYIERVLIDWKEDIGLEGRGGYFDDYGIIRDVVQNHLLQILALIAMERPSRNHPKQVRDEKVGVLRHIPPLAMEDLVIGQYAAGGPDGAPHVAYRDERGIPETSVTTTYAAAVLHIDNERWKGVPFILTAGKALDQRISEVRIQFRELPENLFCPGTGCLPANQLLIRIQPDESIHLGIVNKEPGLGVRLAQSDLNLKYQAAFSTLIPDAYECLLLDVLAGDKSLFIRSDELEAAWDVFTPVLHELEDKAVPPEPYAFGSGGPDAVRALLQRYGG